MADFTQAQLDALNAAIAQGVLRVRYADKEVIYKSTSEMIQARNLMRKSLGLAANTQRVFANHGRGTD